MDTALVGKSWYTKVNLNRKHNMQQHHQLQSKELWPFHQAILLCEELPAGKQKVFVQGKEGYYCVEQAKLPEQYCVKFFKQVS